MILVGRSPTGYQRITAPSATDCGDERAEAWRRRVGIEPTLRRFRAETTVLKTAGATRPHSPPRKESADDNTAMFEKAFLRVYLRNLRINASMEKKPGPKARTISDTSR